MKVKDKLEELEKRIRELEARPVYAPVYHPIYLQPYVPHPTYIPVWPIPTMPTPYQPWWGQVTCGGGNYQGGGTGIGNFQSAGTIGYAS